MENRLKKRLLIISYLSVFLISILLTFLSQSSQYFSFSFYFLGQVFGSLALTALSLQPLLGSRIPVLENGIGLDKILKIHALNGRLLFIFVLLHPFFLFGPLLSRGLFFGQLLQTFSVYHWLGVAAVLLILLILITTIFSASIKLDYEYWKVIHKISYIIVIFGFLHSFYLGSDIVSKGYLYYWWYFLGLIALTGALYRYVIKWWIFKDSWYKITKIIKETHDVRTIIFEPLNGKIFNFYPGQFAYVNFYSKDVPLEEHHFTISASPKQNAISFSVKESGDFTSRLGNLKVGEKAKIEGPYGTFSNAVMNGSFLFIAGGIGITPLMSMIKNMQSEGRKEQSVLIYANKTSEDIVFKKELQEIEKQGWLKVIYVFGRVTEEILKKEVKNVENVKVFLVGPVPMMESVQEILRGIGINKDRIYSEKFALR